LEKLDPYCVKILSFFLLEKQEAHFNELHKLIKEKMKLRKFSKPTFNTHLKHLVQAGYVKRTPDKGQMVTYSLNLEKIGKMKEYSDRIKKIVESQRENLQMFFSFSERQQVDMLLRFLCFRKLYELESRIELELEPDSFEKWFVLNFWSHPVLEQLPIWITKRCAKDEAYRNKILKTIEDFREELDIAIS
jgi:DNA-binding HxlR family transcriptional regulator